jgi:ribosome biogenesis GTPase
MPRPRKIRIEFRKNRSGRRRDGNLTKALANDPDAVDDRATGERLSGKGELTRKRTVMGAAADDAADGMSVSPATANCWRGQVLHVHGLESVVRGDDGRVARCTLRRVLRTLATDQRHPLAAGDWVRVRESADGAAIQAIEPRSRSLSRDSRGRRHVIVANVDQLIIVGSAAMPDLKLGLIDRLLVAAELAGIRPIIVINKADLVPAAALVPLAGVFARMGYPVITCSAESGLGLERLAAELPARVTAIVGQSGVGKSSLLNSLDPTLALTVGAVSRDNEKGRHTTTTARLLPHRFGGCFVDTPGMRQFQPWAIVAAEVPAAFRDLRPFANLCRYPDCTHDHETGCAVKDAVADGLLDTRRWSSCLQLAAADGDDHAREYDE